MKFYIAILLVQMPWFILLAAATRRMLRARQTYSRLQFYGAAIIVLGTIAHGIIFDPNFGLDPKGEAMWAYGFLQVEPGALAIGLIFFGLGLFLDQRPGRYHEPWPPAARLFCQGFLGVAVVAAAVAYHKDLENCYDLPWTVARVVFTLGFYPFSIVYLIWSGRAPVSPQVRMPAGL